MTFTPFLAFLSLGSGPAEAADTWTNIAPGVDLLERVETGSVPQEIFAVRADLTNPLISVHATNDIMGVERGVSTKTFAENVGAIAAINGDWGLTSQGAPISLAIGDGFLWNEHFTDPSVGGEWGFFACDIFNNCEADTRPPSDPDFLLPTIAPFRYFNAVGANGIQLIEDGEVKWGCYDTVRNPRSAICVDSSRTQLWLIAIDGRSSKATGMTCDETRSLALSLGCWDAAMLDGGGSTTLYADGKVQNTPSDGSLRSRPNHIGIIAASSVDSQCSVSSGRWCSGTEISTCSGGRYLGTGDCAVYGASCEEDGDWAYCVHYQCPNGDGQGSDCLSDSEIATCTDGWYGESSCDASLVCGEDSWGAACMDPSCQQGPNSGFCIDSSTAAQCSDGVYTETSCLAEETCTESGGLAACQSPEPIDTASPGSDTAAAGDTGQGSDSEDSKRSWGCQALPAPSTPLLLSLLVFGLLRRPRNS